MRKMYFCNRYGCWANDVEEIMDGLVECEDACIDCEDCEEIEPRMRPRAAGW